MNCDCEKPRVWLQDGEAYIMWVSDGKWASMTLKGYEVIYGKYKE